MKFSFALSPRKWILYGSLLLLLPALFVVTSILSQRREVEELQQQILFLRQAVAVHDRKEAANNAIRSHFDNADHFYIDKHLESLALLERETEELQMIVLDKNFANDSRLNSRLQSLKGKENRIAFAEGVVQSHPLMQETVETLAHPVEIDIRDWKRILSRIEGVPLNGEPIPPGRPQMIITECKLDKKKISPQHEVFVLQLKLVKREFV